ncbi:sensor histidine kinase [Nocardiopsis composta]|uniref:histidine kinase n=1 Tax=Nocardiopsis composta TaxID=157465 RepID=A0A7W8VH05_9ACTN|nr:histidine kinase [Nocardiopsis composta]MBB5436107.1 signal transduction histidine kinase [Nocardiopsis composta]
MRTGGNERVDEAGRSALGRLGVLPMAGALMLLGVAAVIDVQAWLTEPPLGPDYIGPEPSFRDALIPISGLLACTAGLFALPPRAPVRRVELIAPLAPAAVLATTLVLATGDLGAYGYSLGMGELLGIFLAVTAAASRGSRLSLAVMAAAVAAVFLTVPLRSLGWGFSESGWLLFVAMALFTPGLYIRWRDHERTWRVEEIRREERLALARDLHDVVAHQVSGIVVQVQALRYIADRDPERVAAALPDIERAGSSALAAMRRMVGALREEDEPAPLDPHDLPSSLYSLESPGDVGRPRVEVDADGGAAHLPSEASAAVLRMAQEGVTNARRHARGATRVLVRLRTGGGRAVLEVRDNGRGAGAVHAGEGGYGLIGMAERVRLLGGEFEAGPAPDGSGWLVRAELPAEPVEDGGAR